VSDVDYDPSTLYVPDDFLRSESPAMQQWWKIKMQHFDTILFFKVGKFYECYHQDAIDVSRELSIVLMKVCEHACIHTRMLGRHRSLRLS
jgi:DNA mismatch repair protein MSH6